MNLRQKAIYGLGWTFSHQVSIQLIRFAISIVLARLLTPEDFGLVGMLAIFMALGSVIIDGGMASSMIRTVDPDQDDYSTIFWMNVIASMIIYALIFVCAPLIAEFFHHAELVMLVKVYTLSFIISAFTIVQNARLTKLMDFRTQLIVAIPSFLLGGSVGMICASLNLGVWSLVWMHLTQTITNSVQLWIYSGWKPSFRINKSKLRYHFSFGYKLTLSALLEKGYQNLTSALIGRYFSVAQLGYYTRAQSMKQLPVDSISSALNKVTYPLFSSIQNDDVRLKSVYKRLIQQILFWISPTLIFGSILAEPIFRWLLTEKWLPAVPYFQILCILGIMYPIHAYNLNILNVKGRSDLFFKLEVVKKVVGISLILFGLQFGIYGLLLSEVVMNFIAFFINTLYSGKLINYSTLDQAKDIVPILLIACLAGLGVYFTDMLINDMHDLIRMCVSGMVGFVVYFLSAYWMKFSPLAEFQNIVRNQ